MHACVFIQASESAVATGCSRRWFNPFSEAARTFEAAISEVKGPSVGHELLFRFTVQFPSSFPWSSSPGTFEKAINEVMEPSVATDCCSGSWFNLLHFLEAARQERFKERLVKEENPSRQLTAKWCCLPPQNDRVSHVQLEDPGATGLDPLMPVLNVIFNEM